MNGRILTPAVSEKRKSNFKQFVDLYFSQKINLANRTGSTGPDGFPTPNEGMSTKLLENSDGYKAFVEFSMTDYGSSVIKEMVGHQKKYTGFSISESPGTETRA
ncbi:MAG: hypothetical protein OEW97_02930, partial [Gammaproteobacteria bacterium]|nr:hypothetical protein [Gammaproteobacteria bacterium]